MRGDSSLRTDAGRVVLLQLLAAHALGDEARWECPEHRRDMLARAARECAGLWLRFADDLEARRG